MKIDQRTTLTALIQYVSVPTSLDDRVARLREVATALPAFKLFIQTMFAPTLSFNELLVAGPIEVRPVGANNMDGAYVTFHNFMKELPLYADLSRLRPGKRRSKLMQLLDVLDPSDAEALLAMIDQNTKYLLKVNVLVVKSAFPEFFRPKV